MTYELSMFRMTLLGHSWPGFFSGIPTWHSGDWEGTVDLELPLMIGKNCQMDAGRNIGVTHGADP